MKDSRTCKKVIHKLVEKLDPPGLKERVLHLHSRESWTNDEKSSFRIFCERAGALAADVAQGEAARTRWTIQWEQADKGSL